MEKLTKIQLQWIVATLNNKQKEHYQKYYIYNDDLTLGIVGLNVFWLLSYTEQWNKAMLNLKTNMGIYNAEKNFNDKTFFVDCKYTFNEFVALAFKSWCWAITKDDLDQLTDLDWRAIFEEEREYYKSLEDKKEVE